MLLPVKKGIRGTRITVTGVDGMQQGFTVPKVQPERVNNLLAPTVARWDNGQGSVA